MQNILPNRQKNATTRHFKPRSRRCACGFSHRASLSRQCDYRYFLYRTTLGREKAKAAKSAALLFFRILLINDDLINPPRQAKLIEVGFCAGIAQEKKSAIVVPLDVAHIAVPHKLPVHRKAQRQRHRLMANGRNLLEVVVQLLFVVRMRAVVDNELRAL